MLVEPSMLGKPAVIGLALDFTLPFEGCFLQS